MVRFFAAAGRPSGKSGVALVDAAGIGVDGATEVLTDALGVDGRGAGVVACGAAVPSPAAHPARVSTRRSPAAYGMRLRFDTAAQIP